MTVAASPAVAAARQTALTADDRAVPRGVVRRCCGPARRQLPERLHPPPAAAAVGRLARVALPVLRRPLAWYDNVPVVSYVALRGRCRYVRAPDLAPLSDHRGRDRRRVPAPLARVRADAAARWCALLFACALIVLFAIDLEHQILPNVITLPGIVVGFALQPVPAARPVDVAGRHRSSAAACSGLIAEVWLRLRKVEAMGFGDVKMLAMIGAFLGLKLVILTFVLSSLIGGVVGVVLIASRRGEWPRACRSARCSRRRRWSPASTASGCCAWYLSLMLAYESSRLHPARR